MYLQQVTKALSAKSKARGKPQFYHQMKRVLPARFRVYLQNWIPRTLHISLKNVPLSEKKLPDVGMLGGLVRHRHDAAECMRNAVNNDGQEQARC